MSFKRIWAVLLAVGVVALTGGCKPQTPQTNIVRSSKYIGQARGFFVSTADLYDGAEDLASQHGRLSEMATLAKERKLNTIFFEAREGATASYKSKSFPLDSRAALDGGKQFDPLFELVDKATANSVQVFAVLDVLSAQGHPADKAKNPFDGLSQASGRLDPSDTKLHKLIAADAAELVKKYDVAGIVLDGFDSSAFDRPETARGVESLVQAVSTAVQKAKPSVTVGIAFEAAAAQSSDEAVEVAERLAAAGAVSMVIPAIDGGLDDSEKGYLPTLKRWTSAKLGLAELYTMNTPSSDDPYGLQNQLLANSVQGGVKGAVLSPYSYLRDADAAETEMLVSLLAAGKTAPHLPSLDIPQTLAVAYPQSGITVYDKGIYIMGTSDPAQPLTMNGEEVPREGDKGAFGIAVELAESKNTFNFTQGGQTAVVNITRGTAPTGTAPISKITTGSLFPTTPFGVDSNETFEVLCTGPAGASITATLNGETVVMSQTTATQTSGLPTSFKGSFTMNPANFPDDKVTNAGAITYVVGYNGGHEVQKSEGEVFVAGKNVPLYLEILPGQYVASVLTDLASDDNFTQSLKSGARAKIVGKTTATRSGTKMPAYKLSNGGYILGNKAVIVQNPADCAIDITEITKEGGEDWEEYYFKGGQPAVTGDLKENKLTLRFLDSKLTADPVAVMAGGLAKQVEKTDTKDGFELALDFEAGELWGYDITHADGATKLYLRRSPKPSKTFGKPLEGVQILLDPGHGGPDPGALGVAGVDGPTEAVLNMAVAEAARFRLEQLGAQVSMTRVDESVRVSLDERTYQAEKERPHIFLAIHHNSAALIKDMSGAKHMEAYYWEGIAEPMAQNLMDSLGGTIGRKTTEPENAYYYVTRLTFAPAVLFEMGFVVNPAQYEESCDLATVCKAANGIAAALTSTVRAS